MRQSTPSTLATPAASTTVKCCLCHEPVMSSGYCPNCLTFPINVTPLRYDAANHRLDPDGWCRECRCFQANELIADNAEWMDTGNRQRLLTKEENIANAKHVERILSGPGWPEKDVPLREDFIPRRWKKVLLRKVGLTPLGYKAVLPDSAPVEAEDGVPF